MTLSFRPLGSGSLGSGAPAATTGLAARLTSAALLAMGARVTRPALLVEIQWSTTARLSTNGDITWNTYGWSGTRAVAVRGLSRDGGTLTIDNVDTAYGAQCLTEGVRAVPVRIWQADAGALADEDPVLIFEGIADGCEISDDFISLRLVRESIYTLTSPRRRIDAAGGFTVLAAGRRITVGGQVVELEA